MKKQRVRISVANLVPFLRNNETGEFLAIGIFSNKRFAKGERFLQALGGAATITPKGRMFLEEIYGAEFLGEGEDKDDARFIIPSEVVEEVLSLLERSTYLCEHSPMREVLYELEQDLFGECPVLRQGSLDERQSVFLGAFRQALAEDGVGTSARAQAQDVTTRRLFFVHKLCVSRSVFKELCESPYIQVLSKKELDTTQMGRTKGVTKDGVPMADNLCAWNPYP